MVSLNRPQEEEGVSAEQGGLLAAMRRDKIYEQVTISSTLNFGRKKSFFLIKRLPPFQMLFVSYDTLRRRTTQIGSILLVSEGVVRHEKSFVMSVMFCRLQIPREIFRDLRRPQHFRRLGSDDSDVASSASKAIMLKDLVKWPFYLT
jgi:hypothetical protein